MRGLAVVALSALLSISSLSCSVNVLETFSNKNTDEAYFVDAKMLINDADYDGALAKIALMSTSYAAKREVIMLKANAYRGKCMGPTFLTFVQSLANMGTNRLFPFLLSQFTGGTPTRIDSCLAAEDLVESIGAVASRTTDENLFLVLVSFAKIGNILSLYADQNQNGTPDTAADNGTAYNPCLETPRATRPTAAVNGDWFNNDLRQLGTGITLAMANISAVTGSIDLGSDALADISGACSSLPASYNFCSITDPAAFDANQLAGIKTLLKEDNSVGLGTNCTGDMSTCFCPP